MNRTPQHLPKPVAVFYLVAAALNLVAFGAIAVCHFVIKLAVPYRSPLSDDRLCADLLNYQAIFKYLHTEVFFEGLNGRLYQYPAPVAPLYAFFLHFTHHTVLIFEAVLVAVIAGIAIAFGRHLTRIGLSLAQAVGMVVGALVLSFPLIFELRQGNMELFVFAIVCLGVFFFLRENYHLAAICFGVAGAMKLFPAVYLALYIPQKRWQPILTGTITATAVSLAGLAYVGPTIKAARAGISHGLASYQQSPVLASHWISLRYDHSLFAGIRETLLHFGKPITPTTLHIYLAVVGIAGLTLFFTRFRSLPVTNQIAALCVFSVLITPSSFEYTLIHLYIPFALLVDVAWNNQNRCESGLTAAFALLAIATCVATEFIYHGYSYNGMIKMSALCGLLYCLLCYPFRKETSIRDDVYVRSTY